jgi:predicted kinase
VRAKIAAIRSGQADLEAAERAAVEAELAGYLAFAGRLIVPQRGAVVITRGLSGSGKSHVAAQLPGLLPAVRLRSDVERKRLLGIAATEDATASGAYAAEITAQTYARLRTLAETVVRAGLVALVDATFLKPAQRAAFEQLAGTLQVPFAIIDCDAPLEVLRERIIRRARQADNVSDADLAVLDAQRGAAEPLSEQERRRALKVSPGHDLDPGALASMIGVDVL